MLVVVLQYHQQMVRWMYQRCPHFPLYLLLHHYPLAISVGITEKAKSGNMGRYLVTNLHSNYQEERMEINVFQSGYGSISQWVPTSMVLQL